MFFGVPTLYAALVQRAPAEAEAATSLRLAVSAGEPLPADLYRRWRAVFGAELLDAIGSTEVLHCYLSPRPGSVRPGSVGQPVPGYAVRIVDERGDDVPAGGIGELLVHGRSTALAYWQRREQTAEKMRGPWFRSGDQYRVDADGYYWHIGRSRRHVQGLGRVVLGHRGRGGAGRASRRARVRVCRRPTRRACSSRAPSS